MNARHRKPAKSGIGSRQWWTKQLHSWHWISAGLSLVGMLFFAITGITLNHAGAFDAAPKWTAAPACPPRCCPRWPPPSRPRPPARPGGSGGARGGGVDVAGRAAEWASDAITVNLPRPGGDGFVSINPADGAITAENRSRPALAGQRPAQGPQCRGAWVWFIDIFAAPAWFSHSPACCCCNSTPSGPLTWPIVAAGRWCRWC
jgi:hypothetical protein